MAGITKVLTHYDFSQNEIRNAVVQNLASAPGTPKAGQIYYDTTKKEFGYYNGTEWKYSYTLVEATPSVLGGIKLKGDIAGGTATEPQVTSFHLSGDTAVNHKLTELSLPTAAKDAANKEYVDAKVSGLTWKAPAQVATFVALPAYTQSGSGATGTLTANANGALTVDGVAVTVGMRVLVTQGAAGKDNGIYEVVHAGGAGEKFTLLRTSDAATGTELENAALFVREGTELHSKEFTVSNTAAIVVDTTAITWVEFSSGTSVEGDGTYTTREGTKIALKPSTTTPTVPAEGEVSAVAKGGARKATVALTGNGALTEFTVTHNFNTRLLQVEAQENSGGTPTLPVVVGWEPTSANAIAVSFAVAPAKGTAYFVTIVG